MSMLTPALAAHTWAWNFSGLTASGAVMAISVAPGFRSRAWLARNTLNVPTRSMSTTALKPLDDMPSAGA